MSRGVPRVKAYRLEDGTEVRTTSIEHVGTHITRVPGEPVAVSVSSRKLATPRVVDVKAPGRRP